MLFLKYDVMLIITVHYKNLFFIGRDKLITKVFLFWIIKASNKLF